jgi:hypothetical protein
MPVTEAETSPLCDELPAVLTCALENHDRVLPAVFRRNDSRRRHPNSGVDWRPLGELIALVRVTRRNAGPLVSAAVSIRARSVRMGHGRGVRRRRRGALGLCRADRSLSGRSGFRCRPGRGERYSILRATRSDLLRPTADPSSSSARSRAPAAVLVSIRSMTQRTRRERRRQPAPHRTPLVTSRLPIADARATEQLNIPKLPPTM